LKENSLYTLNCIWLPSDETASCVKIGNIPAMEGTQDGREGNAKLEGFCVID
jgi:hypothetical protein